MADTQPQRCTLIIKNGCLVTMEPRRTIIPRGAIAIEGNTIAAVGTVSAILRDWQAPEVIDANAAVVHPGYVDAHLHANAQTCRGFFRGDASKGSKVGPSYADWKATLTPDDENAAAGLASVEMLRHGITTFVEPGSAFEPDAVAAATQQVGIRCTLAEPYLWDTTEVMDAIPGLASKSLVARVPPDAVVANSRQHGVHHPQQADRDRHRDAADLHPVEHHAQVAVGSDEQQSQCHRHEDPERQEPVQR